jgi:hypothetical protein
MPTGTLTIHQSFGSLTDLGAIVRSPEPNEAVYLTVGDPVVRVVFTLDASDPTLATSFIIDGGSGAPYAVGDYDVSLSALDAALLAGDSEGALAAMFDGLTTLALGEGVGADLLTVKSDLTLLGNDLGTHFTAGLSPAIILAGGGDDEIVLHATFGTGSVDGGAGDNDTLWLVDAAGDVNVQVASREIIVEIPISGLQTIRYFDGIEFFRGSAGIQKFGANGEGMRFEGGEGDDHFNRWGDSDFTDVVDYGGETGEWGVVVGLERILDPADLQGLEPGLAAALVAVLDERTTATGNGFSLDTFGHLDYIDPALCIKRTKPTPSRTRVLA